MNEKMSGFPYHRQQHPSRIKSPVHHAIGNFDGRSFRPPFPPEFRPSVPENQQLQRQQQQYQGRLMPPIARGQLPLVLGDFRPQQQQAMDSYSSDTFRPTGSTPRVQEQGPRSTFRPPENFPSTQRFQVHDPTGQRQGFWDRNNPTAADPQRNIVPIRNFISHNESVDNHNRSNAATRNSLQNFSNETLSSFPPANTRHPLVPNVMPPTLNIQRPVNIPYQNILHQHHLPPSMQQQNIQMMRQPYGIQANLAWTPNLNAIKFSSSPATGNTVVSASFIQKQKAKEEADMDRSFIEDWLARKKITKKSVVGKPKALKVVSS